MSAESGNDLSLTKYYWPCQIIGWGGVLAIYIFLVLPNNRLHNEGLESAERLLVVGIYITLLGFLGSHLIRIWFKSQKWIELSILEFWKRAVVATYLVALGTIIIELPILELMDFYMPPLEPLEEAIRNLTPVVASVPFRVFRSSLFMWGIYLGWGAVYWGLKTWNYNQVMRFRNESLQVQQKIAELKLLTHQLKPHFLFNSLNNIRALIYVDSDRAAEMISSLSSILRNTLEQQQELISLKSEVEIVENFLELEKVRLGDRLDIKKNWDEDSLDFKIPPMLLQTVTENAIKHGISKKINGGVLRLGSKLVDNGILIEICNDGELKKETYGLGIGLENCRERLRLLYDGKAELNVFQENNMVHTEVFIPSDSRG